jgi:hypothetical protein
MLLASDDDVFARCRDCGGPVSLGLILSRKDRRVSKSHNGDTETSAYWDIEAPGICAACGSGRARAHFDM